MKSKLTIKGYLGLVAAVAGATFYLSYEHAGTPAAAQQEQKSPPKTAPPSEQIDVDLAVDFPYDI